MNCTAFIYYITLMAKCTCASLHHLLKLLPSALLSYVPIQVSQDGFMSRLIWTAAPDDHYAVDAIYLDFKKSFDSVPHPRLLGKIKSYGIEGNIFT